jgi:hypothetical protein
VNERAECFADRSAADALDSSYLDLAVTWDFGRSLGLSSRGRDEQGNLASRFQEGLFPPEPLLVEEFSLLFRGLVFRLEDLITPDTGLSGGRFLEKVRVPPNHAVMSSPRFVHSGTDTVSR